VWHIVEPENGDEAEVIDEVPTDDSPSGWFNKGCSLAQQGATAEAERALKITIDMQDEYPIAWVILSAVLLSQGKETDAEKAGKMALMQYKNLNMSWPKLRSIMLTHAIERGKDWKSPRKIRLDATDSTEWDQILSQFREFSNESLDLIEAIQEEVSEPVMVSEELEETKAKEEPVFTPEDLTVKEEHEFADIRSAEIWFSKALVHLNVHEFDEAENAYMKGLAIDPDNGEALLRVSTLLMKREVYDKAEESLRSAVKFITENPEAWLQLGVCLQAQERWDESVEVLKIASEKNPKNAEVWVKLGEGDFYRSRYQTAARSFLRALRMLPNHEYALFYLGRCMEYRGNENHALRVYRKLLNLEPDDPEMLEELSKSFHRLDQTDSANRAKSLAAYYRKQKD
jgi:tetratricopeptide (TPR) repeat protein